MKSDFHIACIAAIIICLTGSLAPAEPNSHEHIYQQTHADSRYVEEDVPFFKLVIPDDVQKRFAALDTLPPPMLLNTEDYFDWRVLGGVTPAKNQGNCGSCWAFAATGAFESAVLIGDGVLWDLSEQQVISCNDQGYSCDGGWMDGGWNIFMGYGAIEETDMPYQANDNVPCTQENYSPVAFLQSFEDIPNNINAIKNALMSGPVTTTYLHSQEFQYYCYWQDPPDYLNHVVVIVGWDDNMCDGHGAWIVKNSLGPNHGDSGFDYIPYYSCGIGSYSQLPIYDAGTPELFYSPDSISVDLLLNETITQHVSIFNLGDGDLRYLLRAAHTVEQDQFGYYWFHSDSLIGPHYEWLDISNIGQPIDFGGDINNGNSGPLNLGFDFEFYGNLFNIINVCTNGWVSFTDSVSTQQQIFALPNPDAPNNMLAPLLYPLNFEFGGEAYFYTNYSDSAVITWENVFNIIQGGPFTFQIILVASDHIKFQYDEVAEDLFYRWFVGIENVAGTIGLEVNKYSPYIRDNVAVEFNLEPLPEPLDWIFIDSTLGTIPPYENQLLEISFNAENLNLGDYSAALQIASNDPYSRLNIIPVIMRIIEPTNVPENNENSHRYFLLNQCYPNPFNAEILIGYELKTTSDVKVVIYNILGKRIESLFEGKQEAGEHQITWTGDDQPSGIYFYRIQAGNYSETKKMVLLR
ncbi:MAG: C1 family peptidase [candidate division Zixibacteria bacterium]